jgi:hypothetical protein
MGARVGQYFITLCSMLTISLDYNIDGCCLKVHSGFSYIQIYTSRVNLHLNKLVYEVYQIES